MKEKYGFVYIWYDRKHKKYYVGCRWGCEDDGYICSSPWMKRGYKRRPEDFKRRILSKIFTNKKDLLEEEYKWLSMIKKEELSKKYYNLHNHHFGHWSIDEDSKISVSEKIKLSHSKKEVKEKLRNQKLGDLNPMKRPEVVSKRLESWKKGKYLPWNKGKITGPNIKLSEKMKGREPPNKGKKMSLEQKHKLSKKWIVTDPFGKTVFVNNLNDYCKNVGICASNLRSVAYGKRKHCSGYICKRA
jgi:hypothetical protein